MKRRNQVLCAVVVLGFMVFLAGPGAVWEGLVSRTHQMASTMSGFMTKMAVSTLTETPSHALGEIGRAALSEIERERLLPYAAQSPAVDAESQTLLESRNPVQGFGTTYTSDGVQIRPTVPGKDWSLDLRLASLRWDGGVAEPVGPGELAHEGHVVEIRRPGVVEWYKNTPDGLEQGWTIAEKPSDDARQLQLDIAVAVCPVTKVFPISCS